MRATVVGVAFLNQALPVPHRLYWTIYIALSQNNGSNKGCQNLCFSTTGQYLTLITSEIRLKYWEAVFTLKILKINVITFFSYTFLIILSSANLPAAFSTLCEWIIFLAGIYCLQENYRCWTFEGNGAYFHYVRYLLVEFLLLISHSYNLRTRTEKTQFWFKEGRWAVTKLISV